MVESARRWDAAVPSLRVTRAEAFHLRIPYAESVRDFLLDSYRREQMDPPHLLRWIVRLETDAGLTGVGEAVLDPRPHLAGLAGHSLWDLVDDVSIGPACTIAVYDLAAQARGVPISRLFSASPRPAIQQAWWSRSFPPEILRREAVRGLEAGYSVHKVKSRPHHDLVAQVAAVAEVVPPGYRIVIDANGTFGDAERTRDMAEALKRFPQVEAFEEPIPHHDVDGYRRLRGALPIRLAVHWEGVDPRLFSAESLCDAYVVEDFQWGPPLVSKSEACERTGQRLWVENGLHSGISQVFQAHMAAALPAIELSISLTHMLEDDVVVEPLTVATGGWYTVPTGPGLGVALDEEALERYRIA